MDREFRNVLRRASVRTEYREADPRGPACEKELQGLGEDKLESIRSYAKLLAKLEEVALKTWRRS